MISSNLIFVLRLSNIIKLHYLVGFQRQLVFLRFYHLVITGDYKLLPVLYIVFY